MTIAQNTQILAALKRGERLTPIDALARFKCFRLSARILELKDAGYAIERDLIEIGDKRVAEYRLARQKRAA